MDELLAIIREHIDPNAWYNKELDLIIYEGKGENGTDGLQMIDEDDAWYMLETLRG